MRNTEAISLTRDIQGCCNREHEYAAKSFWVGSNERAKDFECQYNSKIDNICTCKRVKHRKRYFDSSRQVYRSQKYTTWDVADIGVGSVKTVCKRKVKRIYLPQTEERGVGSSNILPFSHRITRNYRGNYDHNKTSSKCVGGPVEYINVPKLSKKLSPIIQTISGSTSPKFVSVGEGEATGSCSIKKDKTQNMEQSQTHIKFQDHSKLKQNNSLNTMQTDQTKEMLMSKNNINKLTTANVGDGKTFSSDSLLQHVHNLENPSNEIIRTSIDLIENKLEREYRKIFAINKKESNNNTQVKPITELKSTTLLRRRFEALRRGINKKEGGKKESVIIKISSKSSVPSRKDVSIASDPPSLEARSYSNTKIYSPMPSVTNARDGPIPNTSYEKLHTSENEIASNWPTDAINSECEDVKGMFRLWKQKFNLDEDSYKTVSKKDKKKVQLTLPKEKLNKKDKGERKRFLFFGKKNKNKSKPPYRSKHGVTAGRCELGDGLMIKIGAVNKYTPQIIDEISQAYNVTGTDWLKTFLSNKKESRNSVKIRWNNNMYTASSSTVFELMDCVYKNTGVIFSSKSDITTGQSSYRHSFLYPQVNFMQQSIQAWMIRNTVIDKQNIKISDNILYPQKKREKNIEITLSNQKWIIEKSKGFAQNIEFVLQSKNLVENFKSESSEYIVIDIPKGYFSETSSDDKNVNQTSEEQVYNIIEYEALNSNSYLSKKKIEQKKEYNIGDHVSKDIQVTISIRGTEEKELKILTNNKERQELIRNVQTSNVYIPKGCDVISVGIITQRDIRDIKKPILKMNDDIDDETAHALPPQKKCEVAESFLQDYYRNISPLGIDLLSWCVSDYKLHGSSDSNSLKSFNNQGDGSKSFFNNNDEYQASAIVSSCETSSCSHCKVVEQEKKTDDSKTSKFFNKIIRRNFEQTLPGNNEKRVLPKDSVEVFKRRKIYAASNKSKWGTNDDRSESFFIPDKSKQNNLIECPKIEKSNLDTNQKPQKKCKKRVLLQDCDVMDEILKEQLTDKIIEGILSFKGAGGCDNCKSKTSQHPKQAQVIPHPICEIPQPPCKESCVKRNNPPCSKKKSPSCEVPTPPLCPVGPPSPCQKPCPPSPPPCRMSPPCAKTVPSKTSSRSCSNSPIECAHRRPMPPKIHSPKLSSPTRSHACICPKNKSSQNISKCSVSKKSSCISTPPHMPTSTSYDSPLKCRSRSPCKSCKTTSSEKCSKSSSQDFPWPLKNQLSKTPSKQSDLSLKLSPPYTTKSTSSKCLSAFKRLIQKISSSSIKRKDCRPDCANRRNVLNRLSPPAPPPTLVSAPTPTHPNQPKVSGLHLKKLPMPKTCSQDCLSAVNKNQGVIRLNSKEKITIKLKQSTPSTEEIREGCNIKVQDEDGQTLYERRDYRKVDRNRMHFVKDMYRESQVQRISTTNPDMILDEKSLEKNECKSDTSVSNIIEISLSLKFKPRDKTTEICINKSGENLSVEPDNAVDNTVKKSSKEIYMLQDKTKLSNEDTNRRDVNIKIMIKNYKAPVKLLPTNKHSVSLSTTDEFTKKISEKFHTVSTGYSDIIEQQAYSVHRTTIDLVDSSDNNKSLIKPNVEASNKELSESINVNESGTKIDSNTREKVSQDILKSCAISQTELSTSLEKVELTNDEKSATSISVTNTDENILSDDTNIERKSNLKYGKYNKKDKRNILKKIFETASEIRKSKNKNEMQEIKQLLRAVLTSDSSDREDFEVKNTLVKELTYSSLRPDYLKNSSSIIKESSKNDSEEVIYPTKEYISECSDSSDVENGGCLCSHLATKLNINGNNINPCCCRGIRKNDREIQCNRDDEDKLNYIHVKTQYSHQLHNLSVNSSKRETLIEAVDKKYSKTLTERHVKVCQLNKLKGSSVAELSDDKIAIKNSEFNFKATDKLNKGIDNRTPSDVLQSNETKKAVLEIYAEKTITDEGEYIIARLPKFIDEKESEIFNYQKVAGYTKFNKKNSVLSIT